MTSVQMVEVRHGDHVLKIARKMEEHDGPNELQAFKAQAIGFFRTVYGEWPDKRRERIMHAAKF